MPICHRDSLGGFRPKLAQLARYVRYTRDLSDRRKWKCENAERITLEYSSEDMKSVVPVI